MDPNERIPRDDWADQDLLTKGEAAERLSAEIAEVSAQLSGAHAGDEILQRRLNGLTEAYRHLTEAGPG
ncbi:hypothetical protein A5685_19665 [Mycobacterium colombiense]|uniref:Uncharacterized protein n=1 Tax=Mycobacterium colombiense TaxID=339268 RepID=A0A1A2SMF9_9MYCO|nr:hypothetical protein [Mycobacterium colombiense]OBH64952.1 hypothetical protein A5685_19665 [Mycobacterium colombiense]